MSADPLTTEDSHASRSLISGSSGHVTPTFAYTAITVIAAALVYYHYHYEGWRETIIFASSITAALVAALALLTRRLLFSIAVVAALVAMIVVAAGVKRRYIDMVLHAYDLVFYMTSLSTLRFLWVDHSWYLIAILASLAGTVALGRYLYKRDCTRVRRDYSAVALLACSALAFWAANAKGERRHLTFYWDNQYVASFYASWSETLDTLLRGQLIEARRGKSDKPNFTIPAQCDTQERPPHIILIHQESVVPPSHFPEIKYDTSIDPFFKSYDGKLHKLRVETYGGASWLTEFSVLTGVSTYSFGGMRTFVQNLMQGKIHDTLPQSLTRCGYRNSVFYPVPKDFVGNGRFYAATGMPEIFDYKGQGATRFNERDKFYYGNVLAHLEKHTASSKQPAFVYLITSATHLPYQYTYEPETKVEGGAPGTDPELHEYLRRLSMAAMDYRDFRAELEKRFPGEKFLIVQYGDHQPVVTRTFLGYDKSYSHEDMKLAPDNPGFVTYYSIDGINYMPPEMPAVENLDVPYLGAVLLSAARLPLSDANAERLRLMSLCGGRYYTCTKKDEILGFHRRLIDSGLVEAR